MSKITVVLIFFLSFKTVGQPLPVIINPAASSFFTATNISICTDKSILLTGNSGGNLVFGGNSLFDSTAFIAKFDSVGNNDWLIPAGKHTSGGVPNIKPIAVLDQSDNIYVVGEYDDTCHIGNHILADTGFRNSFIACLAPTGAVIWAYKLADNRVKIYDLVCDLNGSLYLTGYLNGVLAFGGDTLISQGYDVVLLKIDTSGNYIWMRKAGGPPSMMNHSEAGYSVATDTAGNSYVAGYLRSINPVFGPFTLPISSTAANTGFIARFDVNGQCDWVKQCGGEALTVSNDPSGNIFVGGSTGGNLIYDNTSTSQCIPTGGTSGFIASIFPDGSLNWAHVISSNVSFITSVAADNSGGCYMVGTSRDTTRICGPQDTLVLYNSVYPQPNNCGFIIGLDSTGNPFMGDLLLNSNYSITMNHVNYNYCSLAFTGRFNSSSPLYYLTDSLIPVNNANGFAIVQDGCNTTTSLTENTPLGKHFEIYPNPVNDVLSIKAEWEGPLNVRLFDCTGRVVLSKFVYVHSKIEMSSIPSGLYIISIINQHGEIYYGRVVKN